MATTEDLITALTADVRPVRRLRPPMLRCAGWLALAGFIVAMLGISHGVRPDLMLRFQDPLFTLRVLGALATGVLATVATFQISLPDRSGKWALLPVPAVAAWLSTIGYGCLTDWVSLDADDIRLGGTVSCFATLVLTSTPLSLALHLMMRPLAPLRPTPVILCGALAIAAITATALSLFHSLDATVLILIWNLGVAALFLGLGNLFGKTLY